MAIYDLGTASLAANGEVTGVGTTWKAPLTLIRVGATIVFKTEPVQIYTISEIISDTKINVYNPNSETVPAGTGYAILAHDGITVQGLAQDVAETLRYYQSKETSIESLLQFIGQDTFDWPHFEQLANQSITGAAEALSSQIAAAESAATAVSARDTTTAARDAAIEAINSAGDAGTMVTLANMGIGGSLTPQLAELDWNTFDFKSGARYLCQKSAMINSPEVINTTYSDSTLCAIEVKSTRGLTGVKNIQVSASTGSDNAYRVIDLTQTGAAPNKTYYSREALYVASGSGLGGASAKRVRGLLDVYSKDETFQKSLNFSDVADKETARNNIDVYSKSEILNLKDSISVDDYGAVGNALLADGSSNPERVDDTAAFQAAINAAYRMGGVKVTANGKKNYYIAGKVYVLASESGSSIESNSFVKRRLQIIDFNGATIVGNNNTTQIFMETGFINTDGDVASVFGKGEEEYLTIGTMVMNATLVNFYQGFRFRNHVFGCYLSNIVAQDVKQVLYTERCSYLNQVNIQCNGAYNVGLPRYHLKDNVNIQPLQSCVTGVCDIGFFIEGASEALAFRDCGIESFKSYGVRITGGYNVKFDSCYFESNETDATAINAQGCESITVDNSWIYGNGGLVMFGGFSDNTNVRVSKNNKIGGNATWFRSGEGSNYSTSDFGLPAAISPADQAITKFSAKDAVSVDQNIVVYNPSVGLDDVLGHVAQTSKFHQQKVNGSYSKGSSAPGTVGSSHSISGGVVKWNTGIDYTDTQLVYIALKVDNPAGTWFWLGFIAGGATATALIASNTSQPPSASNVGGKLVISSPKFGSNSLGVHGGEIRLI